MKEFGAIIGGIGLIVVPVIGLKLVEPMAARVARWSGSLITIILFSLCFYIACDDVEYGLIAFAGTALIWFCVTRLTGHQRAKSVDYVVEEPLLDQAVSPELAVELEMLGERFRRGDIPDIEEDDPFDALLKDADDA